MLDIEPEVEILPKLPKVFEIYFLYIIKQPVLTGCGDQFTGWLYLVVEGIDG